MNVTSASTAVASEPRLRVSRLTVAYTCAKGGRADGCVKSLEPRACPTCRRKTLHTVTKSKNGMGETIAEIAKCNEHREWVDGRIGVRDPRSGEWRTVRPPDEKSA